jgi:uncharacterized membrane protein
MSTTRMEGFSDGVFAVAITLLSLGLVVPSPDDRRHTLAHGLLAQWPSYVAYFVAFLTIGIIWINHHVALRRLVRPDHALLILNLMLLLSITTIPFGANLMATYLRQDDADAKLAAAVFSADMLWMSVSFVTFNWFAVFRRRALLEPGVAEMMPGKALIRAGIGMIPYSLAIALAFLSPYISLAIIGVTAIYYALPIASGALSE